MNFARILLTLCSITAAICAVLASAWLYSPQADAGSAVFASPASDFVVVINEHRVQAGVEPLRMDPTMASAAAEWTSHMVTRSFIGHANSQDIQGSTPVPPAKSGENVGRGRTIESLVDAFMQSPTHRSNILDPAFTHIGVGAEVHASSGQLYTTHRFASLPSTLEPAPDAPVTADASAVVAPPAPPTSAATSAPSLPEAPSHPRGSRRVDNPTTGTDSTPDNVETPASVRGSRRTDIAD